MPGRRLVTVVIAAAVALGPLTACGDDDSDGSEPAVSVDLSPAALEGVEVASDKGCNACHSVDGSPSMGPRWVGLAGSEVELEDGTTVVADRAYLERAILEPRAQIRAGYANIMPTAFELTDEELDSLITLLEELGAE